MTIWCNGKIVDALTLDSAERGLLLGDGVFETLAVRQAKPIWQALHLARMSEAARALGLSYNSDAIHTALAEILKHSQAKSEVLRITLTRGPAARGLAQDGTKPSLLLTLSPFDASKFPHTLRLATASFRRNPTAPSCRHKTLSYIDGVAAAREVAGFADDALLLNTSEHVACTTIANIFILQGESLITPALDQGILKGIAREVLIGGAAELGLKLQMRAVAPQELLAADAVFITNSLRAARSVTSIDGKACGSRDIGFITAFFERSIK